MTEASDSRQHDQGTGSCCLQELQITDFRNIASTTLNFGPGLNLVTGANASGKTSLLEAIVPNMPSAVVSHFIAWSEK